MAVRDVAGAANGILPSSAGDLDMRVAILTTYAASKKEPLAELLQRLHAAFISAGLGEPRLDFTFADAMVPGFVSAVDRAVRRYPQLARFETTASALPGTIPPVRQLTNRAGTPGHQETAGIDDLVALAAGVPRSFPFHSVTLALGSPAFGEGPAIGVGAGISPGVIIGDCWWVSGRQRSLMALTIVDADPAERQLPPLPASVAAVLAACGRAAETTQMPIAEGGPAVAGPGGLAPPEPEAARAIAAVVTAYRSRLAEVVARANLPHDLPPGREALAATPLGQSAGPMKPALARAFKAMGYSCKGSSGTFTLRRRTAANRTVELELDVGTWSRSVTPMYEVQGVGFTARLSLPVAPRATDVRQYPIGNPERWQQIVDNLAALVAELDRTFVPEIEAASSPAPAWYRPAS
jgi:hypothetical protein